MKNIILFSILFTLFNSNAQSNFNSFEEIKLNANDTKKPIILIFSGIDWCAPCIKMEKEVFDTEYFKSNSSNFLVYFAKFPKRSKNKLNTKQQEENNKLAEKYNKQGVFPKIVIFSKDLKVIKELYYEKTIPEDYVLKLNSIVNEK